MAIGKNAVGEERYVECTVIVAGGERKECSWRGKIRRLHRDGPCVGEEIRTDT